MDMVVTCSVFKMHTVWMKLISLNCFNNSCGNPPELLLSHP